MEGARLPQAIQREPVSNPTSESQKKIVVCVQEVNSNGVPNSEKTEQIYLYAEKTAYEESKKYTNVSGLGQLVLEATNQTASNVGDPNADLHVGKEIEVDKEIAQNNANLNSLKIDDNTYSISSSDDLKMFASLVNNGNNFDGCIINLEEDIDLENTEWTPIGFITEDDWSLSRKKDKEQPGEGGLFLTDSKAFSGIFDGKGHTIYNLNLKENSKGYGIGLFGLVLGTKENEYLHALGTAKDLLFSNSTIQQSKLNESNYSCVVKNINIENVKIGSQSENVSIAGALVGVSYCCNVNSCTVKNLESYTENVSGGIVGTASATVIQNCSNGTSDTSGFINSTQNAGGVVGTLENYFFDDNYSHSVIYNCTNYCNVEVSSTNAGGIIGLGQGSQDSAVINCINNGTISIQRTSGTGIYSASGIAGNGQSVTLFYNCTNNGEIKGPSTLSINGAENSNGVQLAGISSYMTDGYYYNCVNNGNISGKANYAGGIISATHDYNSNVTLVNCLNTGIITNSHSSGKSSAICAGGTAIYKIEGQVDTLSFVQEYVNQLNAPVDLTGVIVKDKQNGVLSVPENCSSIKVDNKVCDKVIVNDSNVKLLKINCTDVDVELSGNMSATNVLIEAAKSLTIKETAVALDVTIDSVTDVINNGTISAICFIANNITINVTNNGTISRSKDYAVAFYSESVNKFASNLVVNFMNKGTISSAGAYALGISTGTNNTLKIHLAKGSTTTVGPKGTALGLVNSDDYYIDLTFDADAIKSFSKIRRTTASGSYEGNEVSDDNFHF